MITETKNALEKALRAIQKDRNLLCHPDFPKNSGFDDKRITAENLSDLASNHLFDDEPKLFGITKLDGHRIRAYFQRGQTQADNAPLYGFITELREIFPGIFEPERQEYLDDVNEIRKKYKLSPISI